MNASSPLEEYQRRLQNRRDAAGRCARSGDRIATARGAVFLIGLLLVWLVTSSPALPESVIMAPVLVFLGLVVCHGRMISQLKRAQGAVAHYESAVDRLEERWIGVGASGDRYADKEHVYSGDLDVFGRGSLFQLLCRARTRLGEDTLASWLSNPADVSTVRARQAAVDEIRGKLDLREELALLDAEVHEDLDQNCLQTWAAETPQPVPVGFRGIAVVLSALSIAALLSWLLLNTRVSYFLIVLVAQAAFTFRFRKHIRHLAHTADQAGSGLAILSQVLGIVEREQFQTERLKTIREQLNTDGLPPSCCIALLHRLIQSLNNSLQNQFFAPIAFMLCLPIHLIHRIELWRMRVGPHISDWFDAVGEFESLVAIAGHAYERPADPFPELTEGGPLLEAEDLGHPLLSVAECVRNDLELSPQKQLILVSGSNMSGKSTLLRTVGTNVVLALAGAPVRAKRLKLSPLQLGTEMRVSDSLQDGKSLFYAVLSRLKTVVELTKNERPLLFLLDEILQGTNSHDRRIGAEGIIRRLVESGAVGLVTTHDLALTQIVDSFDSRAVNVHFEDQLVDGKMTFDYRIHTGVVERSNALELMRMIGLDV